MTIELVCVRHGESELNRRRDIIGGQSSWCELNALGIKQSAALGALLGAHPEHFDLICTSTAVRAQQTARHVLEAAGIPLARLRTSTALLEQFHGAWEGVSRAEVYTQACLAEVEADAWNFQAPGGESQAQVCARVERWVEEEVWGHIPEGGKVLVFTHGMVLRAVIAKWGDGDTRCAWKVPVENTSVTRCRVSKEGWEVVVRNDVRHLRQAGLGSIEGAVPPQGVEVRDAST